MTRTFEIRLRTLHPQTSKPCGMPQHPNARAVGLKCAGKAVFEIRPKGFAGNYTCCASCPTLLLSWLHDDMQRNAAQYDVETAEIAVESGG